MWWDRPGVSEPVGANWCPAVGTTCSTAVSRRWRVDCHRCWWQVYRYPGWRWRQGPACSASACAAMYSCDESGSISSPECKMVGMAILAPAAQWVCGVVIAALTEPICYAHVCIPAKFAAAASTAHHACRKVQRLQDVGIVAPRRVCIVHTALEDGVWESIRGKVVARERGWRRRWR